LYQKAVSEPSIYDADTSKQHQQQRKTVSEPSNATVSEAAGILDQKIKVLSGKQNCYTLMFFVFLARVSFCFGVPDVFVGCALLAERTRQNKRQKRQRHQNKK